MLVIDGFSLRTHFSVCFDENFLDEPQNKGFNISLTQKTLMKIMKKSQSRNLLEFLGQNIPGFGEFTSQLCAA